MRHYALEPISIGEDTYTVISKGHHDIHAFMVAVRAAGYSWPLGTPAHTWMKTMPARKDGNRCWYEVVSATTRGAWPCTYTLEAYGELAYRAPKENE